MITPYEWQIEDQRELKRSEYVSLVNIEPGGGKGHPLDEPILTPSGFVPVGSLQEGDQVVGSDGGPTTVTGVFDRGELPVYRVTFRDGSSVRVDEDHLWEIRYRGEKGEVKTVVDTRKLIGMREDYRQTKYIAQTPVELKERNLPIGPYVLGSLLADGYLTGTTVQWTKKDPKVVSEFLKQTAEEGWEVRPRKAEIQYGVLGILPAVKRLGLAVRSKDKFIPQEYLDSSFQQRLELAQGLFDGDGSIRKERNTARYTTTSDRLAAGVLQLLWSLGVGATKGWKKHRKGGYWVVSVHQSNVPLFRARENRHSNSKRTLRRSISSIEYEGVEKVRCIQVSAKDRLYVAKDYIVTHNTVTGALAVANSSPDVTLVIAPQSTHESAWAPTIKELTGQDARIIGRGNKSQREARADFELGFSGVYLVTPQLFTRSDVSTWSGDLLIVDEVHLLARPGGKGQRNLSGYVSLAQDNPVSQRFEGRLALSGTPARNKFENLWSVMRLLWPEQYRRGDIAGVDHYMWKYDRMTKAEIVTGYDREKGKKTTAEKWLTEREPGLLFKEAPSVIQHFRRRECCEFHPEGFLSLEEPQEIRRVVELAPPQKKAIKEVERHSITWLDEHPLVTKLPITTQQRIRQMCLGVPSVEWVTEEQVDEEGNTVEVEKMNVWFEDDCTSPFLDEILDILENLDEGEPVAVYLESQKFARVAVKRLIGAGYKAFEYSGQVNKKERNENLEKFGKEGGHQILVGVISSIGTGTDGIQKVCSTEVWIETSTDPTTNEQTQARADRMGARGQVQRFYILDSFGYAEGRMSKQLEQRLKLRQSTTKEK